jgi:hypothetical protein
MPTSTAGMVSPSWLASKAPTGGLLLGTPLEDVWLLSLLVIGAGCAPGWLPPLVVGIFVYHLGMALLDVRFDEKPHLWLVAVYPRVPMWALHIPSYALIGMQLLLCLSPTLLDSFSVPAIPWSAPWSQLLPDWALFAAAWIARLLFFFVVLLGVYLNIKLPMQVFPKPLGPYRVGHHVAYMGLKDGRRCRVRVLFPAEVTDPALLRSPTYSYWPATSTIRMLLGISPNTTKYFGAERYLFHVHMDGALLEGGRANGVRISRAAQKAASLSGNGRLPVFMFSHGLVGCPESDTVLNSQLASWGYICIELEHRDGSAPYTITPWDEGRTITLTMPDDPLRDGHPSTYHAQAAGHTEQRLAELSMVLEVMGQWEAENSGRPAPPSPVIGDEALGDVEELFKEAADFNMVFGSGHSAGAGAAVAFAALEASGRAVSSTMLKTPVAGWNNRALSQLEGTENGADAREVWNIVEDLCATWPVDPVTPRVKLAGTVALDPWVNSLKPQWVRGGMHNARICLVMSNLYGGLRDMSRDVDHYHRRDALLLRQLMLAPSRATAWRAGCGMNWYTPHVQHVIATRGMRNGLDQHAKPLMPVPGTEEEASGLLSVDGSGGVLGVHPLSIVVRNTNLQHLNFNDVTVMLKDLSDFLDWAGSFSGVDPSLGTAPNLQSLLHVSDLIRTMTTTFAKDVNKCNGNSKGVHFSASEESALLRAGQGPACAPGDPAASPTWAAVRALQERSTAEEQCTFHLWREDELPEYWAAMEAYDAEQGGDYFEQYLADVAAGRRAPHKSITAPWLN